MAHVDARIYEATCHEGNYSLSNVLSASRMLDAAQRTQWCVGSCSRPSRSRDPVDHQGAVVDAQRWQVGRKMCSWSIASYIRTRI